MHKDRNIRDALHKLDWIENLSKEACPQGVPENPDALRELLNRIVKDVRGACEMLSDRADLSDEERLDPYGIANATPEVAANILICLSNQGIYLLKRQIERLEHDFVEEGGFTERLYRVRSERRKQPS